MFFFSNFFFYEQKRIKICVLEIIKKTKARFKKSLVKGIKIFLKKKTKIENIVVNAIKLFAENLLGWVHYVTLFLTFHGQFKLFML